MFKKINNLKPFFETPGREFSVREYSREIGCSPATASKLLQQFEKQKYLIHRSERNATLFRANEETYLFKDAKITWTVQRIKSSGLLEHLDKELAIPLAVFLFGSQAKGDSDENSDVDLFVLARSKKKLDLKTFEKKIGSQIQLFLYTPTEAKHLAKTNSHLVNNIINGIRLSGFWEVF